MIPLLATVALAAEPDPLLDALARWAARAPAELALDDARPYRAVLAVADRDTWAVEARFGAVMSEGGGPERPARVEVVTGSDAASSARFRGQKTLATPSLPIEDVPIALDRDLWLSTDGSFKQAVKALEVKTGALAQLASPWPADRAPGAPVVADVPVTPQAVDRAALAGLAREVSAVYRQFPELRSGSANVYVEDGRYALATSDGARLSQPEGYASLYTWCEVVREDGVSVWADRQWVARTADGLPAPAEAAAAARALAEQIVARSKAEKVDYYEGPVVFEGRAVVELLSNLAVPELLGTPPLPQADKTWDQLVRSGPRLGRHLLPEGWSVREDPAAFAWAPSWDREGTPVSAVDLVRDGVVVDLLMTEVPRRELSGSNGHARGTVRGSWTAAPYSWEVTPAKVSSDRAFDKAVARYTDDRVLVIRQLRGATPQLAVWRYPDGREEPVLALELQRMDRRVLRDITAATAPLEQLGLRDDLPTRARVPARLLITELEAVFPGGTQEPPAIPMPPMAP